RSVVVVEYPVEHEYPLVQHLIPHALTKQGILFVVSHAASLRQRRPEMHHTLPWADPPTAARHQGNHPKAPLVRACTVAGDAAADPWSGRSVWGAVGGLVVCGFGWTPGRDGTSGAAGGKVGAELAEKFPGAFFAAFGAVQAVEVDALFGVGQVGLAAVGLQRDRGQ